MHDGDELAGDIQLEEQLSKNTAQYNKLLTEEPSNVEIWLKYVQFQVFSSIVCFISLVDTVFARVICALFFSILAAEKSGCIKYADFLCGGLDLGFILV